MVQIKVSVIIPNYNHAPYLKQRIDSILNQTFQDFEIIILDDSSTDNSKEIIKLYSEKTKISHIVFNRENSGSPFKQWEKGIKLAKGDWLWIAESDDYSSPNFLQSLIDLASANINIGIAFCSSFWVDEKGELGVDLSFYHNSFFRRGLDEVKHVLSRNCSIQNVSSCIIRKDLALKFCTDLGKYKACGDWIFYIRILHHCNFVYNEAKLNYFRWYHNNTSNSANKNGLWISEGSKVLQNIDYKKAGFSRREIYDLIKHWVNVVHQSNLKDKYLIYGKIFLSFIFKYRGLK